MASDGEGDGGGSGGGREGGARASGHVSDRSWRPSFVMARLIFNVNKYFQNNCVSATKTRKGGDFFSILYHILILGFPSGAYF
jgi:hypothetical protein